MEQFCSSEQRKADLFYTIPNKYQYAMGGLVPFFMGECIERCSSFVWTVRPSRKTFPLCISSSSMNFSILWKQKIHCYVSTSKNEVIFWQSKDARWCSESPLSNSGRWGRNLGWPIVRLVRHIGSYGISPFSPLIEIPLLRQKMNWTYQEFVAWNVISPISWGSNIINYNNLWLVWLDQ